MRKRQKFVATAILLSLGLWWVQSAALEWRYVLIALLASLTWVLTAWSLREGLSGIEWLTVLLPLAVFTVSVGFFYILLPAHWLAKLIIVSLFGVGQYALLLSANIFSVAAIRTIALLRAAQAVATIMTLLTGFFLFDTILSLRMGSLVVWGLSTLVTFLLLLPQFWSVQLNEHLSKEVVIYALVSALLLGLLGVVISIWPVNLSVAALFLTAGVYVYLGIVQHHFNQKLFSRTIWEYITVGLVVLGTTLITAWVM